MRTDDSGNKYTRCVKHLAGKNENEKLLDRQNNTEERKKERRQREGGG